VRAPRIVLVVGSSCTLAAAITGIPALASGASSAPPTVTTSAATAVGGTSATLNGSINPNGQQTVYALQWGPTTGYGHETPFGSAGAGTTASPVSATVNGLSSGTIYHFRVIAINAAGTSVGSDQSFTTTGTAPAPSPAPSAITAPASNVSLTGAALNGVDNPAGQATSYYFEYGPTSNYGYQTSPQSAGNGTADLLAGTEVSGLSSGTTFHYRLVAVNAGGTGLGTDETFTTLSSPGAAISHVAFIGRMGFVSPGAVIGVEAGCFGGSTDCVGHVTMTLPHSSTVIGQRDFDIKPNTGGFQNLRISLLGRQLVRQNRVWHLLPVTVSVTTSSGQQITQTMTLARWVWH
jgi:Fibronectin type III domain